MLWCLCIHTCYLVRNVAFFAETAAASDLSVSGMRWYIACTPMCLMLCATHLLAWGTSALPATTAAAASALIVRAGFNAVFACLQPHTQATMHACVFRGPILHTSLAGSTARGLCCLQAVLWASRQLCQVRFCWCVAACAHPTPVEAHRMAAGGCCCWRWPAWKQLSRLHDGLLVWPYPWELRERLQCLHCIAVRCSKRTCYLS